MARITSDVQVVQFCITNTLQVVFRDPFLILFYVVAMLAISVQLSLFSVIYLPVVALLIGTIVKRLRRSAKEVQESFGELTSVLDESLSGMKVIKGYNAETFSAAASTTSTANSPTSRGASPTVSNWPRP